ncbi:ferredoxin-type protein NapF [Bacterioplanoides sp.]|uniref:ferredoxin-type protein NapF n=1 Tax=Bacterioplanoides sp. TaxID=2066072 RepID=UPI003AFF84A9
MATIDHSRRALFRARTVVPNTIRPPWSLTEKLFVESCSRCHECVSVCAEDIIVKGDGGFPEIDFSQGECTFCQDCVNTCSTTALQKSNKLEAFQGLSITLSEKCLNRQGIVCQSCKDMCESRAISLVWRRSVPEININNEACNYCGACVSGCPTEAITISPDNINSAKSHHSPNLFYSEKHIEV